MGVGYLRNLAENEPVEGAEEKALGSVALWSLLWVFGCVLTLIPPGMEYDRQVQCIETLSSHKMLLLVISIRVGKRPRTELNKMPQQPSHVLVVSVVTSGPQVTASTHLPTCHS